MAFSLHGVKVPHRKNTAEKPAVKMAPPKAITLPMSMHIGKPAIPIVKAGDKVCVGTKVAEADGFISSPIHSSVSGVVKAIEDFLLPSGDVVPAIVIESDGLMTVDESVKPVEVHTKDEFLAALKESGIVGLGGAGFPTHAKFSVEDTSKIEELIINGAECEPYITSDSYTMTEHADDIEFAVSLVEKYLGINKIIIAIENNKKTAIEKMKAIAERDPKVSVKVLKSIYPQGGEKVLIYHTTGKRVMEGELPISVGSIVSNSSTMAEIGRYIRTGMPLVERCVTVEGGAVRKPQNVIVAVGTQIKDVFSFCNGFIANPEKILYGGPMMGITVPRTSLPILKQTNAIVALNEKEARQPKTVACIRCGNCTNHCPFGIYPALVADAYENRDAEALKKLGINVCMHCGSCSFVCPSNRPLTQTNILAQQFLRESQKKGDKK